MVLIKQYPFNGDEEITFPNVLCIKGYLRFHLLKTF